jgi:hypothetical protein
VNFSLFKQSEVEPTESGDQLQEEDSTLTLAELLSKVGLQEKLSLFEQEQIDMESLVKTTWPSSLTSFNFIDVILNIYCAQILY